MAAMAIMLTAESLLTPDARVNDPLLIVDDGMIESIASRDEVEMPTTGELHHFAGCTLVPSFFDVHLHGGGGHDVMEASPEAMARIGRFLAGRGVGGYLATTISAPIDDTLESLDRLATQIEHHGPGARILGIHLEGPFLAHSKRGAHPAENLLPPSIQLFDRFWQASRGQIRLTTIAPELPGACELIAHATGLGVRVSMGHSDSGSTVARQGIAAGARSATHTFNAMRPLDHRHPGLLGVVLTDDRLFAEIICDGIHIDPAVVQLFWKLKGPDRTVLVTDSISATGMPDGRYTLGGLQVDVAEGKCMHEGVLAGSVLTMERAVRNFAAFTGAPLGTAVALATRNPARLVGVESTVGFLAQGRRADITVLSQKGEVVATMIGGRFAHRT